jgi:cytochrome c oxidase subunit 1
MSEAAAGHAAHEQAHGHGESFISKYIFSTDHKMIAKQFL